ncbi:hypothetical protein Riv7116_4598 [Rivularia sp. PCC 7116]|uniref:hypothetical protein n=1 Tax=Rivularia sp. PCC 7116 TaxID=373994 RepID=UPI00029F0BA0|nr:hypothetical protein [Rivularia sp. PCC 7116]AFY57017.1 hypothetical protein Riv7116_4598 [Rivularia sp. PCC 7116]
MTEENRSISLGGSAESSAIITGDRNTAAIINYYDYYRENTSVETIESKDVADNNFFCHVR